MKYVLVFNPNTASCTCHAANCSAATHVDGLVRARVDSTAHGIVQSVLKDKRAAVDEANAESGERYS